jgi:hypothetical protein
MVRADNVVDADGHILEPLDLWDRHIDPGFRERRPRFVIDENGRERLSVEGKLLGNSRGSVAWVPSAPGRDRQARHPEVCRGAPGPLRIVHEKFIGDGALYTPHAKAGRSSPGTSSSSSGLRAMPSQPIRGTRESSSCRQAFVAMSIKRSRTRSSRI